MRNVKKGSFTGRLRFSRVIGFVVGEPIGHCVKVSSKNEHGEESESFAVWGTVRFYEPPMFLFPETYREGSWRGWDGRILECAEVCRGRGWLCPLSSLQCPMEQIDGGGILEVPVVPDNHGFGGREGGVGQGQTIPVWIHLEGREGER